MRPRRAIRTVLVYALLGAAATVLTSWAIHAAQRARAERGSLWSLGARLEPWPPPAGDGRAHALRMAALRGHRVLPPEGSWSTRNLYATEPSQKLQLGGWRLVSHVLETIDPDPRHAHDSSELLVVIDAGWPSRALRHGSFTGVFTMGAAPPRSRRTPAASLHGGVQVRPWPPKPHLAPPGGTPWHAPLDRFALPLLPLWPGFLINTAVYGLLLFALVRGVRVSRRALRRRGGRCIGCGYDRAGLELGVACPECGAGGAGGAGAGAVF